MDSEYVLCIYRPKQGMEEQLKDTLRQHLDVLTAEELLASSEHLIMKSSTDGSYIEILEWKSAKAAGDAHQNPSVMQIWSELGRCAEILTLKDLGDAGVTFPHFRRVEL